jgi:hypothetical protein
MKRKFKILGSCFAMLVLAFNGPAQADDAQLMSMIREMQGEMKKMGETINQQNRKIAQLENRPAQASITSAPSTGEAGVAAPMSDYEFNERLNGSLGGANKWLKDLSFKGDLRLRYEAFSNSSGSTGETDDRNRFRYRLRFGWEKKFNDEMNAGFALASGESGAAGSNGLSVDPTSTNTTFDNNFNYKPVFIEKAYASYTPNFAKVGPIDKFNITGGKFDNPFEKGSSDIIWDRDVKPEGVYEKVDLGLIESEDFTLKNYFTAGQFVLDEDSATGGDANLFAYQLGLNAVVYTPFADRPVDILSALSYYDFKNYARNNNFLIGTTSLARGNINSAGAATELDAFDFNIVESYNEIAIYPSGLPVRPYFDVATNIANERVGEADNYAWALGTKLGGINKKGDWEASYAYKRIGSDSVPGFNDSDFGLAGHSGHRGSVIKLGYGITDNIILNSSMFFVNNLNRGTFGILDEQQRRFQVDLNWKF